MTRPYPLRPEPSRRDDWVTVVFAALAVVFSIVAVVAGVAAWLP